MIQKVNRPTFLKLLGQSKAAENDPGSSQGSGMAYERPGEAGSSPQKEDSPQTLSGEDLESFKKSQPASGAEIEQAGMTDVIRELFESRKETPANAGLTTTRYSSEASTAKGLLLNKKIG